MIEPLDRSRRDSTLFQFTSKQLRDFIDPSHLLIKIDEQLDFAKLVAPLEEYYCPDFGRPAIHPEVMARALLICSLYNIASFRRLCSAISENISYRWFCFLTIDDPVFDHSSISHFIDRIGRDGFGAVFDGLNDELLRMGLLSPEMYVDSSLVKANVNSHDLSPSGMTTEEFKEQAVQVNGLFVIAETTFALPRLERYFNVVPRGPAFFSRRSPVLEHAGKRQFIVNRCLVSIAAHGSVRRSRGNAGNVVKRLFRVSAVQNHQLIDVHGLSLQNAS